MRYAVYYTPFSGSLLHQLGATWLGRDAITNQPLKQPAIERIRETTAEPCRYGFHATLKPPFALREGMGRIDLGCAVSALTGQLDAVTGVRLEVCLVDGFLALVPINRDARLSKLAAACVQELDEFRAPPTESELRRRRRSALTERQQQYLQDWGYPNVLEEFRFHMTLTRRLDNAEVERFAAAAKRHFQMVLSAPVTIDAFSIFREQTPGADFIDEERFPLVPTAFERVAS